MEESKITYFQYFKDLGYPVFISLDTGIFGEGQTETVLEQIGFGKVEKQEFEKLSKAEYFRHIQLMKLTPKAARQVGAFQHSDKFSFEKIIPGNGYKIYRHKGQALGVFSLRAKDWEIGVYKDFFSQENSASARISLSRLVAWALAPLGVIGFWGVSVEEGAVIMKNYSSMGEWFSIDLDKEIILTFEGVKELEADFSFIRLDNALNGQSKRMRSEELLSFLTMHTTFFDHNGLSIPARQMVQMLSKNFTGLIYPKENFVPRMQKSLDL